MGFKLKYFSNNGYIVHQPNPEAGDWHSGQSSELHPRQPVIYKPNSRDVFVGEPGWYHQDTYRHYGIPDMYSDTYEKTHEGFFNGGTEWGGGDLSWYSPPSDEEHAGIREALINAGHEVGDPTEPEDEEKDFDWQ